MLRNLPYVNNVRTLDFSTLITLLLETKDGFFDIKLVLEVWI